MKILKILSSIFLLINSSLSQNYETEINLDGCGRRISEIQSFRPNKIINGNRADPEDWGWTVSFKFTDQFFCGGSLINSKWVVSAAHCVDGIRNPIYYSNLTLGIGIHDLESIESWAINKKVSKIIVHPLYSKVGYRNDIALLKLESPVNFSDQILPICIPEDINFDGKDGWATGWGTMQNYELSQYLMEVKLPILTEQKCKQKYQTVDTRVAICAGEVGGNIDTCQGDSGGPLSSKIGDKWYLAGITSWGYGCGDGGVYTRTSTYFNWIKQTIQNN